MKTKQARLIALQSVNVTMCVCECVCGWNNGTTVTTYYNIYQRIPNFMFVQQYWRNSQSSDGFNWIHNFTEPQTTNICDYRANIARSSNGCCVCSVFIVCLICAFSILYGADSIVSVNKDAFYDVPFSHEWNVDGFCDLWTWLGTFDWKLLNYFDLINGNNVNRLKWECAARCCNPTSWSGNDEKFLY